MFTPNQKASLGAKLQGKYVKERDGGGGFKLSYIEGWHAIAEANRIFGYDAWDRETIDIARLGDPYEVSGKHRVAFMAKVRVTVRADGDVIVREGIGYGSGIDRDLGGAHESAIKEAETDAMKRALMTFGNPFGLALYDKTKANVAERLSSAEAQRRGIHTIMEGRIFGAESVEALDAVMDETRTEFYDLIPEKWIEPFEDKYENKREELKAKEV